jgi:hypothetical protein
MAKKGGNPQNLKSNTERTPNELAERNSRAGKKSGEIRKEKAVLREAFSACLNTMITDKKSGAKKRAAVVGATATVARWIQTGDPKCALAIAQIIGELRQDINVTTDAPPTLIIKRDYGEEADDDGSGSGKGGV